MCYLYRPQRSWAKVIFSEACVKNSVHRGGGGSGGSPILGGCLQFFGGSPIFRGGLQFFWGGSPIFQISPIRGRYASYWNAFLLSFAFWLLQMTPVNTSFMRWLKKFVLKTCHRGKKSSRVSSPGIFSLWSLETQYFLGIRKKAKEKYI